MTKNKENDFIKAKTIREYVKKTYNKNVEDNFLEDLKLKIRERIDEHNKEQPKKAGFMDKLNTSINELNTAVGDMTKKL